jgi:hypothetical protein
MTLHGGTAEIIDTIGIPPLRVAMARKNRLFSL